MAQKCGVLRPQRRCTQLCCVNLLGDLAVCVVDLFSYLSAYMPAFCLLSAYCLPIVRLLSAYRLPIVCLAAIIIVCFRPPNWMAGWLTACLLAYLPTCTLLAWPTPCFPVYLPIYSAHRSRYRKREAQKKKEEPGLSILDLMVRGLRLKAS